MATSEHVDADTSSSEQIDTGVMTENDVEQFLLSKNIPYKRNIKLEEKNQTLCEFDFIIPNAIIEVKFRTQWHESDKQIINQLKRFNKYLPNYIIYLLIVGELNLTRFQNILIKHSDIKNTHIVTNMDDIKCSPPEFYIDNTHIVFSLVSFDNPDFDTLCKKFKYAYVKKDIYDYACAILTDKELERFNAYQFTRIDSDLIENCVSLKHAFTTDKTFKNKDKLLNILEIEIKKFVLSSEQRTMQRYVEGYSVMCEKCNHFVSVRSIKRHKKYCDI